MHRIKKERPSPFGQTIRPLQARWKRAVRKWKRWKLYFFLFVTLPFFIVSLIVKIAQTLVRIWLRESAAAVPLEAAAAPVDTASDTPPGPGSGLKGQVTAKEGSAKPVPVPIQLERIRPEKVSP